MAGGGPTSHAAILAASMNIPALVACGPGVAGDSPKGTPLLLDADRGRLTIAIHRRTCGTKRKPPDGRCRPSAQERARASATRSATPRTECASRSMPISVRSRMPLRRWRRAPKAADCCARNFCSWTGNRRPAKTSRPKSIAPSPRRWTAGPLTIRTLDIGGDKPAAYLPFPAEENPALGLRGVRVSLWRPDLLRTQLARHPARHASRAMPHHGADDRIA